MDLNMPHFSFLRKSRPCGACDLGETLFIDAGSVETLRNLLSYSSNNSVVAKSPKIEDECDRILRTKISEFVNVSFEYRYIKPYMACMFAWKGHRQITLNIEDSSRVNLSIAAHLIGHLALNHIDESDPAIILVDTKCHFYDFTPRQEVDATQWAARFRAGRSVGVSPGNNYHDYKNIWLEIRRWKIKNKRCSMAIYSIIDRVSELPGYKRVRSWWIVEVMAQLLYRCIGY
jgi:hypothetical protein